MARQTRTRPNRTASPERWQRAAQRAIAEHVEVRQVNSDGMRVAANGSDPQVAYLSEVLHGIVRSCSCPAGGFGDPCRKHAARSYLDAGVLDPEPDPPAPPAPVVCVRRRGSGAGRLPCEGAGVASRGRQAAVLR